MSVRRRVSEADGAAAFAQVRQVFDTVLSGEKPLADANRIVFFFYRTGCDEL